MKKIARSIICIFFACCLLSADDCVAQITVGESDLPSAGDTLRVSYTQDMIDPTLTGANYTWNYPNLIPISQWVEKFDSPSSFVFPFNFLFNASNTTYGQAQYTPDSIPVVGISLDNANGFFKKSSTSLNQNGVGLNLNALPVPFQYSPQDVIYNFPLNYGDMDSCDSEFAPPSFIPLPYYYGQKIHRENEVDGWGTLITPYGIFQTLRVKSTVAIRDTFADTTGFGFAFSRPLKYEYKWLTQGGKVPYLQINATEIAGNAVVTQISYRDSMRSGAFQLGINEPANTDFLMHVFPNPASDYAFVQYTLNTPSDLKIELHDMNGRKITTLRDSKQTSGPHIEVIHLRNLDLKSGTYFVCLYAGQQQAIRKMIVEK